MRLTSRAATMLGILVDQVMEIPTDKLEPPPPATADIATAIASINERLIVLLEPNQLALAA
jgi:chemotaxis signal transduction protein